ncbi:MAG TPA: AMP-binding protein [Candidatus Polarisedimenticolaceae bacterium]|nr:AMP-binding protein [Candidatus Polarisedimenticolaceae bacterium]
MSTSSSELATPRTLVDALLAAPAERRFVTVWNGEDDESSVSFGEFREQARRLAAQFHAAGLGRGDTVVLILPQGIPLMAAFAGAMLLGAIPAILAYPNFKAEPVKYRSGLAGVSANLRARLIVLDEQFPDALLQHVDLGAGARTLRCSTAAGPPPATLAERAEPEAVAFIQHSAGTTGLQKGVALTHAAVLRQLDHLAAALCVTPADRIYSWLPLYHDMGLIACFMLPLAYHLPVVMQSPTDWVLQPGTMLELISRQRCTLAWVPNFTLQFLARRVRAEDRAGFELSCLRALINCSEPVRARSMDEFLAAYPAQGLRPEVLQSSYAMAENVFAVTQSGIGRAPAPLRVTLDARRLREEHRAVPLRPAAPDALVFVSSGAVLPGNEVRIVDAQGATLPPGAVGEIAIRSDSLFTGYYNRPDLTARSLRAGWYHSGDLGFLLEDELFVIGRQRDLIIVAGKNIYPQDVEEICYAHPRVHDGRAIALGLHNPELGTEDIVVVAEVEQEADLADAAAIERALRNAIVAELGVAARAVYLKPPRWIVKSTAGKPARSTTRDKLLAEHPELALYRTEY